MITTLKKILNQIWKKCSSVFKKSSDDISEELIEEEKPKEEVSIKKLLNTFYLHPEIIKKMPYEMLYNDIFNEIGQMIESLESQWNQNEIDFALGYVTLDVYCEKRIDIREKFEESKKRYLHAMNLA